MPASLTFNYKKQNEVIEMNLETLKPTEDLAWLMGFFKGDGYIIYGRTGIDTITPEFAEKIYQIFSLITKEEIKFEVYGNSEKFKNFLPTDFLQYPSRNPNWSDYVKIRIDSVEFSKTFNKILEDFVNKTNTFDKEIQLKFVQGFFDAEATVTPNCEITIDLSKENGYILELISNILLKFNILTKLKEHKSKVTLRVLGGTNLLSNAIKFQRLVNFVSLAKQRKLSEVVRIYSLHKEERTRENLINEILNILKKEKEIELWELMTRLNVKYDKLKRCINQLVKENKVKKQKFRKSVIISF